MKKSVKMAVAGVALVAAVCVLNLVAEFYGSGISVFKFTRGTDGMSYGGVLYGSIAGVLLAVVALYHLTQAENFRKLIRWMALPFVVIFIVGALCFSPMRDLAAMDTIGVSLGFAMLSLVFSELITRNDLETA